MKMSTTVTVLAIALATTLSAQQHNPKHAGPGNGPRHEQMVKELGLSADQQTKLNALRKEHQESQKATHEQLRAKRIELNSLIKTGSSTDAKIKELTTLHEKMLMGRVDHLTKVKTVLTPSQFETFMAHNESRMENRPGKGMHNGHGNGEHNGHGNGWGKGMPCDSDCVKK